MQDCSHQELGCWDTSADLPDPQGNAEVEEGLQLVHRLCPTSPQQHASRKPHKTLSKASSFVRGEARASASLLQTYIPVLRGTQIREVGTTALLRASPASVASLTTVGVSTQDER